MKEDAPREHLMPIGRFSRMTRLSIKALRLYDETGLLRPSWVDESSGYRYYTPAQATRAEAIRTLRGTDMPLDEIMQVLTSSPVVSSKILEDHHRRLADRLTEDERRLAFLGELIDGRRQLMPYDVKVEEKQDCQVAALRVHTSLATIADAVQDGFATLMGAIQSKGSSPTAPPFIIYHDVIDEETEGDIEMCIPVSGQIESAGDVESKVVSGGPVAALVHKGAYDELGPAYHALSTWITEHGHQFAGPPRETYLNDPTEVSVDELLTEVVWPIDSAD